MTIQYKTKGVCSRQMNVKMENGVIQKVDILGGCAGNSQGVAVWWRACGRRTPSRRLRGFAAATRPTSCPDQLSKALQIALAEEAKASGGLTCPACR